MHLYLYKCTHRGPRQQDRVRYVTKNTALLREKDNTAITHSQWITVHSTT